MGPEFRVELVRNFWRAGCYPPDLNLLVKALREEADAPGEFRLERHLLLDASIAALGRLESIPVPEAVKVLICREFAFFAEPAPEWRFQFDPEHYPFRGYCGIALLERFPAGQLSWEVSGLPRSWLLRSRKRQLPKLLYCTVLGMRGFRPTFCTHVSITRRGFQALVERASLVSYWRLAQALRLQPAVKGIATSSWLYAPETARVSPHLGWLRKLIVENGGAVADIGRAAPDSGFLEGSTERKRLYEGGEFRPREYAAIWPRRAILDWAARHPEFDIEP